MEDANLFNPFFKTKQKLQPITHFSQEAVFLVLNTNLSVPVSVFHQ